MKYKYYRSYDQIIKYSDEMIDKIKYIQVHLNNIDLLLRLGMDDKVQKEFESIEILTKELGRRVEPIVERCEKTYEDKQS